MLDHEDPSVADRFSVSRLQRSMQGRNRAVPSSVHGAPLVSASSWGLPAALRGNQPRARTACET